jgi:hypothetical protein
MLLKSRPRSAYTLLEVLLASAIGVILLGALYVAMEVQLRHAQAGRELIAQGTLVRALMTRISADINASIGPVQPVVTTSTTSSGTGGGTGAAASGGAGAAGTAGSGTSAAGATSSSASGTAAQINIPVQGDNGTLVLTVAKWPRELDLTPNASSDQQPVAADLRRISYWLAGAGSGSPMGLARQELRAVTTSDPTLSAVPPNVADENTYVIAEEVKSLTFQYWDGSAWQDTWDGTQPGADGSTPMGPPIAIAITVEIALPGTGTAPGSTPQTKTYRQVVPLLTANGATQASNSSTTTSP